MGAYMSKEEMDDIGMSLGTSIIILKNKIKEFLQYFKYEKQYNNNIE